MSVFHFPISLPLRLSAWLWSLVGLCAGDFAREAEATEREPIAPDLIYLPGGDFTPASTDPTTHRPFQLPPFYLDKAEVTNSSFASWLNQQKDLKRPGSQVKVEDRLLIDLREPYGGIVYQNGTYQARPGFAYKPVVQVTWEAAQRYCHALEMELPSEEQWLFAALGKTQQRAFPWGQEPPGCADAVFERTEQGKCKPAGVGPQEVGSAPMDVTPEGALDMAGNVSEWVVMHRGSPAGTNRALGGNWGIAADKWRGRYDVPGERVGSARGFRCARSLQR